MRTNWTGSLLGVVSTTETEINNKNNDHHAMVINQLLPQNQYNAVVMAQNGGFYYR